MIYAHEFASYSYDNKSNCFGIFEWKTIIINFIICIVSKKIYKH